MGPAPVSAALQRFTVLDLSRVCIGPTCVCQLADWSANLIKVELPERLEAGNASGGSRHGSEFLNLYRNKGPISINLKDTRGRELLVRLARTADVIVEDYRPDVKRRLGIDRETLSSDNPGLVYTSISGFGQDRLCATRPGFDQIPQSTGGLMSITDLSGQASLRAGSPIANLRTGLPDCSLTRAP